MENKNNIFFSNPWMILIQGVLVLLFGLLALANPEIAIKLMIRFFGLILTITGVSLIIIHRRRVEGDITSSFWFYFGIINTIIGLLFLVNPKIIVSFFFILIGLVALLTGALNLYRQMQFRENLKGPAFIKNGIALLFGLLILLYPFEGAEAATIVTGIFAVIYGISALAAGFRMRR